MTTRVCELLGIKYPIVLGAMATLGTPELASAVSNAGGLGVIVPGPSNENLQEQIHRMQSMTDKPFGVNLPLVTKGPIEEWVDTVIQERVPAVTTSAGNPKRYTQRLKDSGVKVIHVAVTVDYAVKANEAGVDAIVAMGIEGGGHHSLHEMTTFALVPQVVDAVDVPVLAAGGIGDARGFLVALALGAEGVQIGTRFIATRECIAHENYKKALVEAKDTDTVIIGRRVNNACRVLTGPLVKQFLQIESGDGVAEEVPDGRTNHLAAIHGNMEVGYVYAGQAAGLIKEIMSAKELIEGIIIGSLALQRRLDSGPLSFLNKPMVARS